MKKKPTNQPAENHYDLSLPEVKSIWDTAYAKGLADKQLEIYEAVKELDVDTFDDVVYKKDVLALIKGEKK